MGLLCPCRGCLKGARTYEDPTPTPTTPPTPPILAYLCVTLHLPARDAVDHRDPQDEAAPLLCIRLVDGHPLRCATGLPKNLGHAVFSKETSEAFGDPSLSSAYSGHHIAPSRCLSQTPTPVSKAACDILRHLRHLCLPLRSGSGVKDWGVRCAEEDDSGGKRVW
ncbi:hypothetical protein B0H12DRAFT_1070304 [Mycena haematopus]|nr:hypothetical protein B0H12DRAFT_1070304 [Mycena haematopus]